MEVCGGCIAACLSTPRFRRKCVPRQSQPLRLGGDGDGFTQQCPFLKRSLFRATAFGRAGRCDSWPASVRANMLSTSRLLFDGKQYSRLGKGAVERSM